MYDQFRWTNASTRRNDLTIEYEPVQPFFLLALAEKVECETFLDVGANIGVYSLFATLVPTIKRIMAFEANSDTVKELRTNISTNDLNDRIEVIDKAVSSRAGTVTFGVIGELSGANSVVDTTIHDRSNFQREVTVEAITLDKLFPQPSSAPVCIKIDVEGHECEVIDGATGMLRVNEAVIQVEGYDEGANSAPRKLNELGYFRLTTIGPDHYFSNVDKLRDPANVIAIYERAMRDMIAFNHRNRPILLKRWGIGLQLTGKSAAFARRARRMIRRDS